MAMRELLKLQKEFLAIGYDAGFLVRRGEGEKGNKVSKSGFITRDPRIPYKNRSVAFEKGHGYYYLK